MRPISRRRPVEVAPGATARIMTRVFAGAKEVSAIDGYRATLGIKKFDLLIDWGWFYFITKPLFNLIDFIYQIVGNFGVAILCVTVIVKAVFFPLANQSYRSMAKMKLIQPKLAALKELYPDDTQKQQQAQMELMRKEGVNPVAGCLPMLPQIPVFFALYNVFSITIEMRHAPFFGWIKDLSAPDPTNIFNLFGLVPFDPTALPVFGHFLHLGIWPLIMGFTMFLQMKMQPEPTDPTQKMMFMYMPFIFTFMFGSFPAGLVIYYAWNNTLTVLQQSLIMKRAGTRSNCSTTCARCSPSRRPELDLAPRAADAACPRKPLRRPLDAQSATSRVFRASSAERALAARRHARSGKTEAHFRGGDDPTAARRAVPRRRRRRRARRMGRGRRRSTASLPARRRLRRLLAEDPSFADRRLCATRLSGVRARLSAGSETYVSGGD